MIERSPGRPGGRPTACPGRTASGTSRPGMVYGSSKPRAGTRRAPIACARVVIKRIGGQDMRKKTEQGRGRVSARALMLIGGAAAVIATAVIATTVAIGGGSTPSPGRQDSSPQGTDAQRDVARDRAPAAAQLWRKPNTPAASPAPAPAALPRGKDARRSKEAGPTKHVGAVSDRVRADEPAGRREPVRPRRPAATATDRRSSRPASQAEQGQDGPVSSWPAPLGPGQGSSLLGMKCDELFPPHKPEFQMRNAACHRLLG